MVFCDVDVSGVDPTRSSGLGLGGSHDSEGKFLGRGGGRERERGAGMYEGSLIRRVVVKGYCCTLRRSRQLSKLGSVSYGDVMMGSPVGRVMGGRAC